MTAVTEVVYRIRGTKWVNLNGSHGNHYAHQQLMNAWKDLAMIEIHERGPVVVDAPVTITAIVHRTTNARSDAHNVLPTIKACIDGLVACGVIEDDHDGIVRRTIIERGAKTTKPTIDLIVSAS